MSGISEIISKRLKQDRAWAGDVTWLVMPDMLPLPVVLTENMLKVHKGSVLCGLHVGSQS
jgi:hypothetical protein